MTQVPTPRVLSTLVYVVKDKKTLMMHRVKKKNDIHLDKYNGLGGKLEEGETPYQCAQREVHEESGLIVEKMLFKGNLYFPKFDKQGRDWQVYLFRVDQFREDCSFSACAEGNLIWVDNDKLLDLNLWQGDKIFLPYVFTDHLIDARFSYQDGELISHQLDVLP